MSDFLAAAGHHDARRATRRAHHRRPRPRRRRQRDLARQRRARGGARSEDPLLLAARGDPRSLPVGRALGRHRRHARQDDDDVADRLAADARRRRSERARRRHRRELRDDGQLPRRRRPRVRDRRRRVRQRVLRQDGEVPEVPARHRRRQQHRVRPRRHLSGPRRDPAGVPAARQPGAAARAAAARRRQRRRAGAASARAVPRSRRSGCRTAPTGRRTTCERRDGVDGVQRAARRRRRSARFEVPLLGAYNVRNALAAIAVGAAVGLEHRHAWRRACARSEACGAGMEHRGTAARRRGLRRLRAPSDRDRRDADRRPVGLSRPAHLGDLRAAIGDIVPAHLSGGLRARARRAPIASSCRRCSARRCRRTERLSAEQLDRAI